MDSATRNHVRTQIDAASRKREGLPARKVTRSSKQAPRNPGWRQSDAEVEASLRQCAHDLDVPIADLRMAQYRAWRDEDKARGLSAPALKKRLAAQGRSLA